jgi:hypothetical protein
MFEKKPNQFWREISIQVSVILLQLYKCKHEDSKKNEKMQVN